MQNIDTNYIDESRRLVIMLKNVLGKFNAELNVNHLYFNSDLAYIVVEDAAQSYNMGHSLICHMLVVDATYNKKVLNILPSWGRIFC